MKETHFLDREILGFFLIASADYISAENRRTSGPKNVAIATKFAADLKALIPN
jgi:hypothetical protein